MNVFVPEDAKTRETPRCTILDILLLPIEAVNIFGIACHLEHGCRRLGLHPGIEKTADSPNQEF